MAEQRAWPWLPRIALLVFGGLLCFVGINGAMNPSVLSGLAELAPAGITGIRVDFGGFHLGLGVFALYGVMFRSMLKPALIGAATTMTLVLVTRLSGLAIDGITNAQLSTLANEIIPFMIAVFGLGALLRNSRIEQ